MSCEFCKDCTCSRKTITEMTDEEWDNFYRHFAPESQEKEE